MNAKEYKQLKRNAEDRYKAAIEKANKQRIDEITAIETLWKAENPTTNRDTENGSACLNPASYGSLSKAIKEALKCVQEHFSKDDIKSAIQKIAPEVAATAKDSSITGSLIRLTKDGIIERVSKGSGSTPSRYKKLTNELPDFMKD
jgi:hypothetical protein